MKAEQKTMRGCRPGKVSSIYVLPFVVMFWPCVTPLVADTVSVKSRRTLSAGAVGNFEEPGHFQFLEWASAGERPLLRAGVEARHMAVGREPEPKHARLSLAVRNELLSLELGNRYMPGPRTRFLAHSRFYSGFPDIANPRRVDTLFVRPGHAVLSGLTPSVPLPGLFAPADHATPGLFAANDAGTFLAAWHFASRRGVLALNQTWNSGGYRGRVRGDVVAEDETVHGFVELRAEPAPDQKRRPRIISHWERRAYGDDFRLPYHQTDVSHRRGKSGTGSVQIAWRPHFVLEAAGEDRGLLGMRLAGALLRMGGDARGRLLVRGRAYRLRHYGRNDRDEPLAPYEDAGGGLGYALERRRAGFRILYEQRRAGGPTGEIGFWIRGRGLRFTLEAVFGPPREDFLFLQTRPERGTGSRFHPARTSALIMRIQSESFYFYLSSVTTKDKPDHYANLQFKLQL